MVDISKEVCLWAFSHSVADQIACCAKGYWVNVYIPLLYDSDAFSDTVTISYVIRNCFHSLLHKYSIRSTQ